MRPRLRTALLFAVAMTTAVAPTHAQTQDFLATLSGELTGKHFVLVGFPADPVVTYHFGADQFAYAKVRLHAFADFAPDRVRLSTNQLTIEGQSRVYMHDSKSGKVGPSATQRPVTLVIDLGTEALDAALSRLRPLLFIP